MYMNMVIHFHRWKYVEQKLEAINGGANLKVV